MQKYANNFQDRYGNGIPSALVTVTSNATGLPATIYSDDGVTPSVSLLTDAVGQFEFYAADGRYTITLTKVGVATAILADILLEDPASGNFITVEDFGASSSASADVNTLAIKRALLEKLNVSFGPGPYAINDTLDIRAGQQARFCGTVLNFPTTTLAALSAVGIDDWAILGNLTVVGSGNAVGTAKAVYVAGANRYRVEGVTGKDISGWVGKIDPGTPSGSTRGDQGQWIALQAFNSYIGFEDTVGTGAEYCTLVAPMISGCTYGANIASGNTTIIGGNIVDNANGLQITNGSNHAHGICSGVNVNHNTNYNLKTDGVTYGHTFSGCHFYGDSLAGAGKIWLLNSKGISFTGGNIDAMVQCDGTTGPNYLKGVIFPGAYTTKAGANPEYLYLDRCTTLSGPSAINDSAQVFAYCTRTTDQALIASGLVVAIMNSKSADNRIAYSTGTGIFTTPTTGTQLYEVSISYTITAASGLTSAGSYVAVQLAGVSVGYIPIVPVSGALAIANGSVPLAVASGAEITVVVQINAGAVTPVLSSSNTKQSIKLLS